MLERKQRPSETLMIRLARVAGSVAGTLAAKTAKVVARTESPVQEGGRKSSGSQPARPKQGRANRKKKAKRGGPKRKRNRTKAA
jgi:hypothetical protein